jgi:hypothetical protein
MYKKPTVKMLMLKFYLAFFCAGAALPIQTVFYECQREMCDILSGSHKKNYRKL